MYHGKRTISEILWCLEYAPSSIPTLAVIFKWSEDPMRVVVDTCCNAGLVYGKDFNKNGDLIYHISPLGKSFVNDKSLLRFLRLIE